MTSKEEANFVANYLGNLANSERMWVNLLVAAINGGILVIGFLWYVFFCFL